MAPEKVTMNPSILNPADPADIATVDFYKGSTRVKRLTAPPFTHSVPDLAGGSYEFQVIVTDVQGRRGWSNIGSLSVAGPNPATDDDSDGLPDMWELEHFGNLAGGPSDDADGDGKTNIEEYTNGTDPMLMDTDGDGIPDGTDTNPLARNYTAVTISNGLRILTPDRS